MTQFEGIHLYITTTKLEYQINSVEYYHFIEITGITLTEQLLQKFKFNSYVFIGC